MTMSHDQHLEDESTMEQTVMALQFRKQRLGCALIAMSSGTLMAMHGVVDRARQIMGTIGPLCDVSLLF
jgi:hypothetical protein